MGVSITEETIHRLVDRFYARARQAWAAHLARVVDFWSSVMLRSGRYHGEPFSAHLRLPDLEPAMFDRWLALFGETCAEVSEPDVADAFRERAERIASSLRMGLFERLPARSRISGLKEVHS